MDLGGVDPLELPPSTQVSTFHISIKIGWREYIIVGIEDHKHKNALDEFAGR